MKTNAPKAIVWTVALILAIVGFVLWILPFFNFLIYDYHNVVSFLLMTVAYVLLMLGTTLKGF
jgi:hypothetical protein